jgi:hypothetical protein
VYLEPKNYSSITKMESGRKGYPRQQAIEYVRTRKILNSNPTSIPASALLFASSGLSLRLGFLSGKTWKIRSLPYHRGAVMIK